ncbi:hypothetical protein [Alteripontixanthobacter muriae]|uniref:hypothetical protein n=1 Tax=Alteripontixanthobacter muriae TaxID=2705546 RepID=UPI0019D530BA|nr:hypothetical protein [Alteripontixanthobacter muriae]
MVNAPPLYIQEKIHPKAIIEDLKRASARAKSKRSRAGGSAGPVCRFQRARSRAAHRVLPARSALVEPNDTGRRVAGDGGLAERENLKGRVQCIYIDPPYGIKFNSNFQWSTTSREVKDGNADHLTREPEQVKAFRDTWRDGIHSYLTYLRDRPGEWGCLITPFMASAPRFATGSARRPAFLARLPRSPWHTLSAALSSAPIAEATLLKNVGN